MTIYKIHYIMINIVINYITRQHNNHGISISIVNNEIIMNNITHGITIYMIIKIKVLCLNIIMK